VSEPARQVQFWVPGLARRAEDRDDVARLRAALDAGCGGGTDHR
jgi:hypothetical protein